jgi:hypothetical protein
VALNRNKFLALSWRERLLFLQSCVMLPATALALRVVGVQRWQSVLARLSKMGSPRAFQSAPESSSNEFEIEPREIARLVRAAANHGLYRANCLEQSLVLWWALRRNRIESEIHYGARKEQHKLHAHAWVECCGVALNEDRGLDERYSRFSRAPVTNPLKSQ